MAFCNKLMTGIRKIMDQIDKPLGDIIAKITLYTAMVKAGTAFLPQDSSVLKYVNEALGEITGVVSAIDSYEDNLKAWLDTSTSDTDREKKVFTLASTAAKAYDVERGEVKSNMVYDTGTQARIVADK